MSVICAAAGCNNGVLRRAGQPGRPPIYCSPACRPSRRSTLSIEIDHDHSLDAEPGRDWLVRLRHGQHSIVLRDGLGRFSAAAFAAELRSLLPATIDEVTS